MNLFLCLSIYHIFLLFHVLFSVPLLFAYNPYIPYLCGHSLVFVFQRWRTLVSIIDSIFLYTLAVICVFTLNFCQRSVYLLFTMVARHCVHSFSSIIIKLTTICHVHFPLFHCLSSLTSTLITGKLVYSPSPLLASIINTVLGYL